MTTKYYEAPSPEIRRFWGVVLADYGRNLSVLVLGMWLEDGQRFDDLPTKVIRAVQREGKEPPLPAGSVVECVGRWVTFGGVDKRGCYDGRHFSVKAEHGGALKQLPKDGIAILQELLAAGELKANPRQEVARILARQR